MHSFQTRREEILADQKLFDRWVEGYHLLHRVRHVPYQPISGPEHVKHIFFAYFGAVAVECGPTAAKSWLSQLLNPSSSLEPQQQNPFVKREDTPPSTSSHFSPPPYARPEPPPSAYAQPPAKPPTGIYAQIFQQTAAQRRVKVDFAPTNTGPPHAPIWTIRALVDGDVKGSGTGPSKQLAKEEACRNACYALGWTAWYVTVLQLLFTHDLR